MLKNSVEKKQILTYLISRSCVRTRSTRTHIRGHNRTNIHISEERDEGLVLLYRGRNSPQPTSRFQLIFDEPPPLDQLL